MTTYADEQIELIANEMALVQSFDPWSAKTINEAHLMLRAWHAERLGRGERDGEVVAWMHPHIVSFKNARTSCPAEHQDEIEGTVSWSVELIGDGRDVVDKHGVTHKQYPLYAHPRPVVPEKKAVMPEWADESDKGRFSDSEKFLESYGFAIVAAPESGGV